MMTIEQQLWNNKNNRNILSKDKSLLSEQNLMNNTSLDSWAKVE